MRTSVFSFSVSLVCSVQLAQAVTLWTNGDQLSNQLESGLYYRDQAALSPSGVVSNALDYAVDQIEKGKRIKELRVRRMINRLERGLPPPIHFRTIYEAVEAAMELYEDDILESVIDPDREELQYDEDELVDRVITAMDERKHWREKFMNSDKAEGIRRRIRHLDLDMKQFTDDFYDPFNGDDWREGVVVDYDA